MAICCFRHAVSSTQSRRLRYAPAREPPFTQQLGVAVYLPLELPREFAAKIGNIIREEAACAADQVRRLARTVPVSGSPAPRFAESMPWLP